MLKIKQMFCKHNYKLKAKRKSTFCNDYIAFTDFGDYTDYLYVCKKCGKQKIETIDERFNYKWKKVE